MKKIRLNAIVKVTVDEPLVPKVGRYVGDVEGLREIKDPLGLISYIPLSSVTFPTIKEAYDFRMTEKFWEEGPPRFPSIKEILGKNSK